MVFSLKDLLPPNLEAYFDFWLAEDIPHFDYGGALVGEEEGTAILYGKSPGILAGQPFFEKLFQKLNCKVSWFLNDGDQVEPIQEVAQVKGPIAKILQGERTALNLISRLSGIATTTQSIVTQARKNGYKGVIAGTRKTTPGLRLFEKYALLVGGADTHRFSLSTMIMIKDNHIKAIGSIPAAIQKAKAIGGFSVKIEVECQSFEQAKQAIEAGADIIMLDNFPLPELHKTAVELKKINPKILIEASGGITPLNVLDYAKPPIDIISLGYLTHHITPLDFSLKLI